VPRSTLALAVATVLCMVPSAFSLRYNRGMPTADDDVIEDVSEDGFRIVRENKFDLLLNSYYMIYNQQLFNGSLPQVPVFWAKRITQPNGCGATAVYVPGDAKLKRQYIAIPVHRNRRYVKWHVPSRTTVPVT
jgi:hypothetical protein